MTLHLVQENIGQITCRANDTISAGEFVLPLSTNTDVVTSAGMSSFAVSDLTVEAADATANHAYVIGIAAEDATSGEYFTVYTEGIFIMKANETVVPGAAVQKSETDAEDDQIDALDAGAGQHRIGVALTGASAADAYCVVKLNI